MNIILHYGGKAMRKRKTAARLTASALAVCMVAGCMPAGAAQQVEAADLTDDSWQEIQSIVGRYYGEWNTPMEPMDGSREGIDMPNTALLGNGDVGVASGGTEEEKKFYFSKGDFWAYGPSPGLHEPGMMAIGGVTIGKSQEGITTVEAEDFVDAGDVTIEGGGTSVGYIDTGDWMEYTVSIDEPGTYKLNYRVAVNSAGTVEFVANGKTLATTDLPRTGGWSSWKTMSDKVEFAEAGEYTIRLNVVQGGWNFDKLTLELDNSLPEEESENLALNKPIKVCSSYTDQGVTYGGDYVVDGDTSTKWCSLHDDESTHWAIVDLGEKKNIGYYKLVHSGIVGETQHNTVDYQLQYLDSEEENWDSIEQVDEALWKDMDVVTGNTSTETSKSFETPVSARYIRLLITNPAPSNKAARIHELELREEAPLQYYEKQDILNAEIQTTQELAEVPTEMKTWLSSDKNIMVTELTSNGTNAADFQVETWASTENKDIRPVSAANDDDSVTITRSTEKRNEEDEGAWISKAALSTKIIGAEDVTAKSDNDAGKGTLTFTLEPEQTVYIVTAVGGGGRTYTASGDLWEGEIEPETEAAEILSTVSDEAAVSELNTARQEWWKDYWSTSYVDFGTEDANLNLVQKYYYGAQYILGSSAREDKTAPGLYGVWRTNDKPGFRGDYHLNYNFIASFYGTNSSNRPELSLSGVQALLDFVPEGQRRASSVEELKRINADFVEQKIEKGDIDPDKGIEGAILFPVGIGPNGSVTDDAYHNEALDAAYNSYLMTEYYDYTLDKEFLENGVYDYMKQAVAFYEAWLEKEETTENEDGYEYVLYAGYNEGSWAINPAVELAALKSTLRNLIKFSEDIGKDEDKRADWIDIYEHLGDQPTTVVDGKTVLALGEKQWDGSSWVDLPSPIPGDGNALPLDAMIPGGVYNYFSSPEDLQMIQDTIDVFSQRGAWSQINNFSRLFPEAVKSRYPIDSVVTNLVNVIKSQMEANLRINDNTHGLEKSGSTETINSMMLISEDGITKIFPNWYTDKDAKFANLRAKGAFVVSAEYDGAAQEAKNVTITSEAGADMTLVSPWAEGMTVKDSEGNVVATTKGTVPNWEDLENATYTFATTAGETYTVEKGETATEKPSKNTLEYFLNKAKEHQANGDVDNCVESIKNLFAEAIAEGEAVMADENATYDEVMDATVKLMKAIQALDMKAADKTDLEMAVELAQSIDLTKYVEAGQAEFQQALAAAQEVLADGDAMQADADTAWNALVDAISNLRLKADKSTLEDLLNSVADLDLSQYTEESAAVFRTALANAQAVLADETLTEDDQKTVDDAVQALSDAKDQLQLKDASTGDGNDNTGDGSDNAGNGDGNTGNGDSQTPGNGDNSGNNGNSGSNNAGNSNAGNSNAKADAPKTGDTAPIMGLIMLGILSGTAALMISRKRVK